MSWFWCKSITALVLRLGTFVHLWFLSSSTSIKENTVIFAAEWSCKPCSKRNGITKWVRKDSTPHLDFFLAIRRSHTLMVIECLMTHVPDSNTLKPRRESNWSCLQLTSWITLMSCNVYRQCSICSLPLPTYQSSLKQQLCGPTALLPWKMNCVCLSCPRVVPDIAKTLSIADSANNSPGLSIRQKDNELCLVLMVHESWMWYLEVQSWLPSTATNGLNYLVNGYESSKVGGFSWGVLSVTCHIENTWGNISSWLSSYEAERDTFSLVCCSYVNH